MRFFTIAAAVLTLSASLVAADPLPDKDDGYGKPNLLVKPPSGGKCPSNYYWYTDRKCCVPRKKGSSKPVCQSGYSWEGCYCKKKRTDRDVYPRRKDHDDKKGHGRKDHDNDRDNKHKDHDNKHKDHDNKHKDHDNKHDKHKGHKGHDNRKDHDRKGHDNKGHNGHHGNGRHGNGHHGSGNSGKD